MDDNTGLAMLLGYGSIHPDIQVAMLPSEPLWPRWKCMAHSAWERAVLAVWATISIMCFRIALGG